MSNKKPVDSFYYSEQEWNKLGCGPLPAERNKAEHKDYTPEQKEQIIARSNPKIDGNVVKGYN